MARMRFYPVTCHIPVLDGIRAVAALLVMALHFTALGNVPEIARKISLAGQMGVDLFFVLSGFLITRILLSSKSSPTFFSHFYIRRVLRIFPLYYGFLVLWFFVRPWLISEQIAPFTQQMWSWFFLENIPLTFTNLHTRGPNPYWTLAVEEHFYLVWPLLVFATFTRARLRSILICLIVAAPLSRAIFLTADIGVSYFTLTRLDGLSFGALIASIYDEDLLNKRTVILLVRTVLFVLSLVLVPLFLRFSGSHLKSLQVVKLSLIPGISFGFVLFVLIDPMSAPFRALLETNIFRWLGQISYGLYVFHQLVFEAVARYFSPWNVWLRFLICFGLTILIAYLSYTFFESPIRALKSKFRYQRRLADVEGTTK